MQNTVFIGFSCNKQMKTDEWANSRVRLTLELEPFGKENYVCHQFLQYFIL